MDSEIAHPLAPSFKPEEIARRFAQYRFESAQPLWNFQVLIDKSSRAIGVGEQIPQRGGPAVTLALLSRTNPACDVEIVGQWLDVEIHPADWLDLWLAASRIRPVSSQYVRMPGGTVGDVVGTWAANTIQWIGRFFCLKAGPRLFLLCFRCRAVDYPRQADDFFVSISSFSVADQSPGPLAEPTVSLESAAPLHCRVAVPASWKTKVEAADDSVWSFEADLNRPGASEPQLQGRLSFALGSVDRLSSHEEAFAEAMEAAAHAGLAVRAAAVDVETAATPFLESWLTVCSAAINGQKAQVRCRVLRHSAAWAVAMSVSVDAQTSPQAWMRTKRALDLLTSSIEFPG